MDLKKFCIPIFFSPVVFISQNHILALLFHILNTMRISIYLFGTADMLMWSFWRRRQSKMQYCSVNLNYMLVNSRFSVFNLNVHHNFLCTISFTVRYQIVLGLGMLLF
jgi:hypothetical protein